MTCRTHIFPWKSLSTTWKCRFAVAAATEEQKRVWVAAVQFSSEAVPTVHTPIPIQCTLPAV